MNVSRLVLKRFLIPGSTNCIPLTYCRRDLSSSNAKKKVDPKKKGKVTSIQLYHRLNDCTRLHRLSSAIGAVLVPATFVGLGYLAQYEGHAFWVSVCSALTSIPMGLVLTTLLTARTVHSLEYIRATNRVTLTTYHALWGKRLLPGDPENLTYRIPEKTNKLANRFYRLFRSDYVFLKHSDYKIPFYMHLGEKGVMKNEQWFARIGIEKCGTLGYQKPSKQDQKRPKARPQSKSQAQSPDSW